MNTAVPLGHRLRCAAAGLCLALSAAAAGAAGGLALLHETELRALDDPHAALVALRQQLAAAGADRERERVFWGQLALAELLSQMDERDAAQRAVQSARAALSSAPTPAAARREKMWLDLYQRHTATAPVAPAQHARQQAAAREAARAAGDEHLLCRLNTLDAIVYVAQDDVDEAWVALEAVERCAARLGEVPLQVYALSTMAPLAARVAPLLQPQTYTQRALQVLGDRPARRQRAWLLDDLGWALVNGGQAEQAWPHFEQALALATAVGSPSFTMRGHEGLAEVLLRRRDAAGALQQAQAALRVAERHPALGFRRITAQAQVVEASVLLRRGELEAEIRRLRALARDDLTPRHAELASLSIARGLAALGRHEQAYAELERFIALSDDGQRAQRDRQAQRLQARYESRRRDAENAALRLVAEQAQVQLRSSTQDRRVLVGAVVVLAALLAVASVWLTRALARRRRLAELALRDELTGLPNRRAVLAFAREQFALADRLALPITLALIDLDHFKDINDRHGHVVGDRVLQAFAAAAGRVLRVQDRMGRWGGEEWLLVMPGARADELPALFSRLRAALADQPVLGLPPVHGVTFSMGVAQRSAALTTLETLIAEADRQLYRAKHSGRDALCRHDDEPAAALAQPLTA